MFNFPRHGSSSARYPTLGKNPTGSVFLDHAQEAPHTTRTGALAEGTRTAGAGRTTHAEAAGAADTTAARYAGANTR
jgi:hypothetical protein